jgi:hypothetical protein
MIKSAVIVASFLLLLTGCSSGRSAGMGHTESYTADNEIDLKKGNQRIRNFKQELLAQGLRVISSGTSSSPAGSREQFILTGNYGQLRDLEVTLWTSSSIVAEKPQLGAGARTQIRSDAEEQEFRLLEKRLRLVATGLE